MGASNINLTEEYLQEERVSNSRIDEEEKQQMSVFTGFGFFLFLRRIISLIINNSLDGQNKTDDLDHSSAGISILNGTP